MVFLRCAWEYDSWWFPFENTYMHIPYTRMVSLPYESWNAASGPPCVNRHSHTLNMRMVWDQCEWPCGCLRRLSSGIEIHTLSSGRVFLQSACVCERLNGHVGSRWNCTQGRRISSELVVVCVQHFYLEKKKVKNLHCSISSHI